MLKGENREWGNVCKSTKIELHNTQITQFGGLGGLQSPDSSVQSPAAGKDRP